MHDLGGLSGFGPVVTADGELTHLEDWELRAQVVAILGTRGTSMRGYIERLDPATYLESSYYVRWLLAGETATVDLGLLTPEDLDRWRAVVERGGELPEVLDADVADLIMQSLTTRGTPMSRPNDARFAPGDAVIVRRMWDPTHHHRCPRYVRGAPGVIDAVCGEGRVPEGDDRGWEPEYTVGFSSVDLWGRSEEAPFRVYVDLYEHYLEAA